jgi:hypothetical protein
MVTQWNTFLMGKLFQVSTLIQLTMITKPKKTSVTCTFPKFLVRGKGVVWPFAPVISDCWLRNLSGLFHKCCWTCGRTHFDLEDRSLKVMVSVWGQHDNVSCIQVDGIGCVWFGGPYSSQSWLYYVHGINQMLGEAKFRSLMHLTWWDLWRS